MKQTRHIAALALAGKLPKGCNGEDAAAEFTRHLLPSVRAVLLAKDDTDTTDTKQAA